MAKNKVNGSSFFAGMASFEEREEVKQKKTVVEQKAPANLGDTPSEVEYAAEREATPVAHVEPAAYVAPSAAYTAPVARPKTVKRERRSVRLNLLTTPTIANAMKDLADREGRSMNDLFNEIMLVYIEENF